MKWASVGKATGCTLWTTMGLVALVAALRLCWVASRGEIGWHWLAYQWQSAATLGQMEPASIVDVNAWDSDRYIDFWLAEVDRVLASDPSNAELIAGAAVALHKPLEIKDSLLLRTARSEPGRSGRLSTDAGERRFERFEAEFERRCAPKSIELMRRATTLAPHDVRWWRLRALLLRTTDRKLEVPRVADWMAILEDAAGRDGDNALYDYLAGCYLWDLFGGWDPGNMDRIDPDAPAYTETYDERIARLQYALAFYRKGQEKPFLAMDAAGVPALARFLERTRFSRLETFELVRSQAEAPWNDVLWDFALGPVNFAELLFEEGRPAEVPGFWREAVRMIEQWEASGEYNDFASNAYMNLGYMEAGIRRAQRELSPQEVKRIQAEYRFFEHHQNLQAEASFGITRMPQVLTDDVWQLATREAASAAMLGVWISMAALLGRWLLGWGRGGPTPRRALGTLATCVAIWGLSFVIFGMCPAWIVSPRVQRWPLIVLVNGAALVGIAAVWRAIHSRRDITLRTVLSFTAIAGPVTAALIYVQMQTLFAVWPPRLPLFPMRLAPNELWEERVMGTPWTFAVYQWLSYHAPMICILLCCLAVGALAIRGRSAGSDEPARRGSRALWALRLKAIGRTALLLAVGSALTYSLLAPPLLREIENYYQENRLYNEHPDRRAAAIKAWSIQCDREHPSEVPPAPSM